MAFTYRNDIWNIQPFKLEKDQALKILSGVEVMLPPWTCCQQTELDEEPRKPNFSSDLSMWTDVTCLNERLLCVIPLLIGVLEKALELKLGPRGVYNTSPESKQAGY